MPVCPTCNADVSATDWDAIDRFRGRIILGTPASNVTELNGHRRPAWFRFHARRAFDAKVRCMQQHIADVLDTN